MPAPRSQTLQQLRFKPDICALAALTYELLTGTPPYPGRNFVEQDLNTIPLVVTRPPSLSKTLVKPAELTDNAWRVLLPCLRYQVEACPDRAEEWLQRLQAAQGPSPPEQRSGGKKWWWAILLAAGIALSGLYLLFSQHLPSLQATIQSLLHRAGQPPPSGAAKTPPADSDELAFTAAAAANTVNAYRDYLQRCSICAHRQEAESAIQRLQAQLRRATLQARFTAHLQARELGGKEGDSNNALAVLRELATLDPQDPFIAGGNGGLRWPMGNWRGKISSRASTRRLAAS